jgi:AcrR family transcriptional regulator
MLPAGEAAMARSTRRPRRTPRQERSRQLVDAVREAGRLILEEEGPEALTTTRIAERAGVSVGSLYQYFENREAILEAIYGEVLEAQREQAAARLRGLAKLPLPEQLREGVRLAVERHRALLALDPKYYTVHHARFRIGPNVPLPEAGDDALRFCRAMLEGARDQIRPTRLDHAAFLLARGIAAILRVALEEQPALLDDPGFLEEVGLLMERYLLPPGPPAGAGSDREI